MEDCNINNVVFLKPQSSEEIKSYYKHYFKYLTNLEVVNFELANNKSKSLWEEKLTMNVNGYAEKVGEKLVFVANFGNRLNSIPDKIKDRKNNLVIVNGYVDFDRVVYTIPSNYVVSFIPQKY